MKSIIDGETLINNKKHTGNTNSVGFCFLNIDEYTPEEAMHFLSGIVNFDVCAIFETEAKMNETFGVYASPIKQTGNFAEDMIKLMLGFNNKFTAKEYCITEYTNKNFKLIKYSKNIWKQWEPKKEQSKLKYEKD